MAQDNKKVQYNPFAVNILRLQKYNFSRFGLEEIVFFEYMMIKAKAFRYKPFYHSSKTIADETGIKKARLATIINRFVNEGFLDIEIKGFPKVKFFVVNIPAIHDRLTDIYQLTEYGKPLSEFRQLLAYFGKLLSEFRQQKEHIEGTYKEPTKKPKDLKNEVEGDSHDPDSFLKFSLSDTKALVDNLEYNYNKRRRARNNKYPKAILGFKKEVMPHAHKALNELGQDFIYGAFAAYTDKLMNGELSAKRILPYFFNTRNNSFDVINAMADVYNNDYVNK